MDRVEAINRFRAVHGGRFDYSKVTSEKVTAHDAIVVVCPSHGEFTTSAAAHWRGSGRACRKCLGASQQITGEEVLRRFRAKHGDRYDYSRVTYTGNHDPVIIICREHGEFLQGAKNHWNGAGCHVCNRCGRRSTSQVVAQFKAIHGDLYDYSGVKHVNNKTKVSIRCREHGVFFQRPNDHLSRYGCPSCSVSGFDPTRPGRLYYLNICDGTAYKIGITNLSVEERFKASDLEKIKVIRVTEYAIGADAYTEEQRILNEFKCYKWAGYPLLSSGNSELFTFDVLGLDHETV